MDAKMENAQQLRPPAAIPSMHRRVEYEAPAKKMSMAWIWIPVLLLGLGATGYFIWPRLHAQFGAGAAQANRARDMKDRPIPVVAATSRIGDMHIYMNGLGTVTPLNTVTVRSRVDGQLMKINFIEGQTVNEGEPLFEIDPRPFQVQKDTAEGQMAKDQAALKNAKADLERYVIAKEAVSQQQYDTAAANVAQFEGAVKVDQAAIDNAKLNITYSKITAPLTGRIGLKMVDQGNMIHASDANGLAVINQLKPIAVLFSLAEDNIPQVVKEMNRGEKLVVDAFDRGKQNKLATGTLLAIDGQIDQTSGSVRFKAIFPNDDGALFPNQFVNARLLVDTIRGTVLVPTAAIQRSPTATFCYVIKEDGTVEMREVEVGPSEGDQTSIDSGLEAGEKVVTDGVDKLQPGSKVSTGGGKPGSATNPTTGRSGQGNGERNGKGAGGGQWNGEHGSGKGAGGNKNAEGSKNVDGGSGGNGQRGGGNRGPSTRPVPSSGAEQ